MGYNLWMKIPFTKGDIWLCDMKRWCYINLVQGQGRGGGAERHRITRDRHMYGRNATKFLKYRRNSMTQIRWSCTLDSEHRQNWHFTAKVTCSWLNSEMRKGRVIIRFGFKAPARSWWWGGNGRTLGLGSHSEHRDWETGGVQTHATFKLDSIP